MDDMNMISNELLLSVNDGVATITIKRPERKNRLTDDLLRGLGKIIAELDDDENVSAVILTGAGKIFSTGFDIHANTPEWKHRTRTHYYDHVGLVRDTLMRIWHSRLPFIAAIRGQCLGGAVYLSAMCDFVIVTDDVEIGMSELKLGMSPPLFNIFPWLLNMRQAREFLYLGNVVDGPEAVSMGLASRSVPDDELMVHAMSLANELSSMPERVIENMKRSVNHRWELAGVLSSIEADMQAFIKDKLPQSDFLKRYSSLAREKGGGLAAQEMGVSLGLSDGEHPW